MSLQQTAAGPVDLSGPVDPITGNVNVFGTGGVVNTNDTSAVNGTFFALQAITDVTFTTLTETGATGSLNGETIVAGTMLYGSFTGYQLASGTLRAYRVRVGSGG